MGVSKNNGTPKWMVKIRANPYLKKMDDLGGKPTIFGNTPYPAKNKKLGGKIIKIHL